jgi:hypothetical protein
MNVPRLVCFSLVLSLFAVPLAAQWQVTSPDGNSSVRIGFLAQPRAEIAENASGDDAQDLFFRRLRLIMGGNFSERLSFFFDTDSPNLGKANAAGTKNAGDIFVQDFALMYRWADDQYVDIGMLLLANSHNSGQGAVSLLGSDYGAWTFLASEPTGSRVGRDYGVRARGYVLGDHLEYRAGVYQGARGAGSSNSFRFLGRLVYNVFEAEKGIFYAGTYLGKKRVLSFGASRDQQEEYSATTVDAFFDHPVAGGNAVTLQAAVTRFDGSDFLLQLPEQDVVFFEGGFYFGGPKLLPFVQYTSRDFDAPGRADQEKVVAGIGWMLEGHGRNLKLAWGRTSTDGGPDLDELSLMFQIFKY